MTRSIPLARQIDEAVTIEMRLFDLPGQKYNTQTLSDGRDM
jgi:hypothetical protein